MGKENPIIGIHKGVPYRKYNRIILKVGEVEFKKILDAVESSGGMPIPKLLAHSSKPCDKCKDVCVIVYDKEGSAQKIPRGILSKHIPESNGVNIIQQAISRQAKNTNG